MEVFIGKLTEIACCIHLRKSQFVDTLQLQLIVYVISAISVKSMVVGRIAFLSRVQKLIMH